MINPGDHIYVDNQGRIYSKSRKGRRYYGHYSFSNKKPVEEGEKIAGVLENQAVITREQTKEAGKLKTAGFSISTNTVKIPEMKKA